MKKLCLKNCDILHQLTDGLLERIDSLKIQQEVSAFFRSGEKLMNQMELAVGSHENGQIMPSCKGNLKEDFIANTEMLLTSIPEQQKSVSMQKLPQSFANSIDKIISYMGGDDSWLVYDVPGLTIVNDKDYSNLSLSEDDEQVLASSLQEQPLLAVASDKSSAGKDPGYPPLFNFLSINTNISYLLLPLFDAVFPQNTSFASSKHCKKSTGENLNTVLNADFGEDGNGRNLLYKVLSDSVLEKIFNDDRLISMMSLSINIMLLKIVIATALYRLEKQPEKFPVIGGVIAFVELEEEMLGVSTIFDTLIRMVATEKGAKSLFLSADNRERKEFLLLLEKKEALYGRILDFLPKDTVAAQRVTQYWQPKFSSLVVYKSSSQFNEIENIFPEEQRQDIQNFLQYIKTD